MAPTPRFKCSTPSVRIANTEFCRSKKNAEESATTKSAFVLELKNFFFEEVVVVVVVEEETCFFLFERRAIFTRHAHVSCRCLLSVICLSRFGGEEAFFFRARKGSFRWLICVQYVYIYVQENSCDDERIGRARLFVRLFLCTYSQCARADFVERSLCLPEMLFPLSI